METYEFTIVTDGLHPKEENFEGRFYDAGCNDALVSFQNGHVLLDFSRKAASLPEAIASAVEHVERAGATIARIEPDPLVNLSDIAARSSMSRAAITYYFKAQRLEGFPPPVARVTTSSPLWDWAEVSTWLYHHGRLPRDKAVGAAVFSVANDLLSGGAASVARHLREKVSEKVAAL
jgi:predicted DNA-binding transcriptional regulator AlpA